MCERTPDHHEYDSELLANNAQVLHGLEYPHCGGIHAWPCQAGNHWHIGHRTGSIGRACKERHADWHRGVAPKRDTLQQSP